MNEEYMISPEIDELFRQDFTGEGITKRSARKVDWLIQKADEIESLLTDTDIQVDVILDTGFNSLSFLSLTGPMIEILDKRIMKLIREGTSYINIFRDEDRGIAMELGFAHMSVDGFDREGEHHMQEYSSMTAEELVRYLSVFQYELKDAACDFYDQEGSIEAVFTFREDISIRNVSAFWILLGQISSLKICQAPGDDPELIELWFTMIA